MRVPRSAVLLAAAILLVAAVPLQVEKYNIDTDDTYIGFTVRHMMVTNVKGKFKNFQGDIELDPRDITRSTAHVTIDVNSLSTDNDRRDHHLKSDEFLNAAQYPEIRFTGKGVRRHGKQLALVGDLTIRDVTRPVEIPFTMTGPVAGPGGKKLMGIEAELTINRFDYNLKYNRLTESVPIVAPDVHIELKVAANTAGN